MGSRAWLIKHDGTVATLIIIMFFFLLWAVGQPWFILTPTLMLGAVGTNTTIAVAAFLLMIKK